MKRRIYTEDHEAFRASAREFVDREVRPRMEEFVEARAIARDIWIEAGKQGLLGLEIPEEYGGSEAGDYRFNAVLGEEFARVSASVSSCLGIHADVVAPYLRDLCTEEQKQRWLPRFCTGELVTAIAMTEPSGGSDLAALKTTAVRDGDMWVLNGSKTFITNGYSADLILVAARTSPEKGAKGITLFGVEAGMPGQGLRSHRLAVADVPRHQRAQQLPCARVVADVGGAGACHADVVSAAPAARKRYRSGARSRHNARRC